jgi:hypothetical protein
MFIIISLIISLLEVKNIIKDKKIKLIIFFLGIIWVSVFLYIKRDDIDSLKIMIEKIKGFINGKN